MSPSCLLIGQYPHHMTFLPSTFYGQNAVESIKNLHGFSLVVGLSLLPVWLPFGLYLQGKFSAEMSGEVGKLRSIASRYIPGVWSLDPPLCSQELFAAQQRVLKCLIDPSSAGPKSSNLFEVQKVYLSILVCIYHVLEDSTEFSVCISLYNLYIHTV